MAVTSTTNLGLSKPDNTELAKNWNRFTALYTANNTIITDVMDINVITYTPTLIASTSNPAVGSDGTIKGEYSNVQGIVFGSFYIEFGNSGVSVGSGNYAISLPFPVDGTFHTVITSLTADTGTASVVGSGYAYDISDANTSGLLALEVATISSVSYVRLVTEIYTTPTKTSKVVSNSQPFSPVAGDKFSGTFIYKKA